MDVDEAMEQARKVERGEIPSGSGPIIALTGPNSLSSPGWHAGPGHADWCASIRGSIEGPQACDCKRPEPTESTRQVDLTLVFEERVADRLLSLLTDGQVRVKSIVVEFPEGSASFEVMGLDGWCA